MLAQSDLTMPPADVPGAARIRASSLRLTRRGPMGPPPSALRALRAGKWFRCPPPLPITGARSDRPGARGAGVVAGTPSGRMPVLARGHDAPLDAKARREHPDR